MTIEIIDEPEPLFGPADVGTFVKVDGFGVMQVGSVRDGFVIFRPVVAPPPRLSLWARLRHILSGGAA